ncbi:DUF3789 domain-containing protein [Extibacter muris]|uniref:DUF3789 domain-containing protein n=1 Tax=Extibacter muris TaxID=1796622 RepID=A0A4R4F9W0_9FIRM|nr:DUF3789 domain-containing protein [Extibacter muris]MCU0081384.1 DUF3789 domain-containing protein [Extibacter muris]TDA20108.1 DUF3789 domain-containing protein [Extibacter muris]
MWKFLCGMVVGTAFGVVLMCLLQINRINGREGQNEN